MHVRIHPHSGGSVFLVVTQWLLSIDSGTAGVYTQETHIHTLRPTHTALHQHPSQCQVLALPPVHLVPLDQAWHRMQEQVCNQAPPAFHAGWPVVFSGCSSVFSASHLLGDVASAKRQNSTRSCRLVTIALLQVTFTCKSDVQLSGTAKENVQKDLMHKHRIGQLKAQGPPFFPLRLES